MPDYKNPALPVEQRVTDLLGRMTLEEKAAQTQCIWQKKDRLMNADGTINAAGAGELLKNSMGQIARLTLDLPPDEGARRTNAIQKYLMENTRLGIPVIFHEESLHGFMAKGATSFPQAIALASTWNPKLIEEVFGAAALEARSRGASHMLTPVLDLARDPRWGRTEETYGEDPYLISRLGVACVKGFQGKGPSIDNRHVIATAKHFAVHGQPERGLNLSPGNFSERVVRGEFLAPFQAVVTEGGVLSVMASYNEIDGIPSHANRKLLQNILREEWGFRGFVVSDYSGIPYLQTVSFVARDKYEAARKALEAGVDIELPDVDCYGTLVEQIKEGRISEAALDRAVARILRSKFLLGLFDNPYVDVENAVKVTNSPEHRALALKAAHEAIILLKNDNRLLPLNREKIKRLAVIGPNAADVHLGGYSYEPPSGISILEGVRNKAGKTIEVRYCLGCRITEGPALAWQDSVKLADPAENARLIKEAVEVAKACDAVLLCIGENEQICREAWAKNHLGDRNSLDLIGQQNDLLKAILETGVPTVVFLTNGRPLSINYAVEKAPAILEGWYLGQEGGTAAADILFGDVNPGGRLPITFPRSVGDIPAYYYHKPSLGINYIFETSEPLFPFGYGLSYTAFRYSNLRVSPEKIGPSGKAAVSVDITNSGPVAGDEVAQMYIRDVVSSVTRPVKELKGFERITLKAGETRTVTFELNPEKLSFINEDMKRVVEPGEFRVMVGPNSRDVQSVMLEVVGK